MLIIFCICIALENKIDLEKCYFLGLFLLGYVPLFYSSRSYLDLVSRNILDIKLVYMQFSPKSLIKNLMAMMQLVNNILVGPFGTINLRSLSFEELILYS